MLIQIVVPDCVVASKDLEMFCSESFKLSLSDPLTVELNLALKV